MRWNWQQDDWPPVGFEAEDLRQFEDRFLEQSGVLVGASRHLRGAATEALTVDVLSREALKTSEIEGEHLDRESVRSSIRRHLGLSAPGRSPPAENGIAALVVDVHERFGEPLSHGSLFEWHRLVSSGRMDLEDVGRYRTREAGRGRRIDPDRRAKGHAILAAVRGASRGGVLDLLDLAAGSEH